MASASPLETYALNEIKAPPPVQSPTDSHEQNRHSLEGIGREEPSEHDASHWRDRVRGRESPFPWRHEESETEGNELPATNHQDLEYVGKDDDEFELDYNNHDDVANLTELAVIPLVENVDVEREYSHHELEGRISQSTSRKHRRASNGELSSSERSEHKRPRRMLRGITLAAYLTLFSILGTFARVGLEILTLFPSAPAAPTALWANFAGCVILGILEEAVQFGRVHVRRQSVEFGTPNKSSREPRALRATPLYIGLVSGFCGSLTSFSSFSRDVFLALAGQTGVNLHAEVGGPSLGSRGIGGNVMALLGVVILTISLSVGGVKLGGHLSIFGRRLARPVSQTLLLYTDALAIVVTIAAWTTAIVLAVMPPGKVSDDNGASDTWRGEVLFALALAPPGCLLRFYISIKLNTVFVSFPLGTFVVNTLGSALLAMAWDLQHAPFANHVGSQVLQGVMDGFCGSFTTVSTWALELITLRPSHAYRYAAASVVLSVTLLVVITGTMWWTIGWASTYPLS